MLRPSPLFTGSRWSTQTYHKKEKVDGRRHLGGAFPSKSFCFDTWTKELWVAPVRGGWSRENHEGEKGVDRPKPREDIGVGDLYV